MKLENIKNILRKHKCNYLGIQKLFKDNICFNAPNNTTLCIEIDKFNEDVLLDKLETVKDFNTLDI